MAATAALRLDQASGKEAPAFPPPSVSARPVDRDAWIAAFRFVRAETERRAAPLSPEDQQVQSMADASPTKWHRAHTTWFFEQFLLREHLPGYGSTTSGCTISSTRTTSPPARVSRGSSAA